MLDQEIKYYEAHEKEWEKTNNGSWVLIKGEELIGIFSSDKEAILSGFDKFGLQNILVRQIGYDYNKPIFIPSVWQEGSHCDVSVQCTNEGNSYSYVIIDNKKE
jgi:hypothetical protein